MLDRFRPNPPPASTRYLRSPSLVRVCALAAAVLAPVPALAVTPIVAVHVSEFTANTWRYTNWKAFHPSQFLEEALIGDGTPFIRVSDADIASGALREPSGAPRYPILLSLAAESISNAEASQISAYVNAGGHVYVGSSSWTRNETGAVRKDAAGRPVFALSGEMGLRPSAWIQMSYITKVIDDPMIDHLPSGVSEWQMPRQYSFLDIWTPHWAFGARTSNTNPATVLLTSPQSARFGSSFGNPPLIQDAGSLFFRYGDVNNDGRTDLVYRAGDAVHVRLSNGQGFRSPTLFSTWSSNYSFDIADVNGDGSADLVGRSGSDVQVGLSNGTSFRPSTSWTFWSELYNMRFADVDGDGDADVIGRLNGGDDVQVGLSTGVAGGSTFAVSARWTTWSPSYTMAFADVDGDRDADIIGRLNGGNDVQVGLSTSQAFQGSTQWTAWDADFNIGFADVNGDGLFDLSGVKVSNNFGSAFPIGALEVALSGGASDTGSVKLATKNFGAGRFIYNSEIVPLAGYGGFANDNSEYKTIRTSIVRAFNQGSGIPLVTLSAWPFPYEAAVIYRHDHAVAADVHQSEQQIMGASSSRPFGEYYVMPELANMTLQCSQSNDYTARVPELLATGGMIGAHVIGHVELDSLSGADALAHIRQTVDQIQSDTGNRMAPIFVAPVYRAIKRSSLMAIRDAGFLTTGEQGVGPFPHFSFDPENKGLPVGTVLQLPVSEWPGYDNIERMSADVSFIRKAASLSYELNGLINVYDHVGADGYASGCSLSRVSLANTYLNHVATLPRTWVTNSLDIRSWWLRRDGSRFESSFTRSSGSAVISATMRTLALRASTAVPITNLALRINLDSTSQSLLASGVRVTLDGVVQTGTTCQNNAVVHCNGPELLVKVGGATSVGIRLGA